MLSDMKESILFKRVIIINLLFMEAVTAPALSNRMLESPGAGKGRP